MITEFFSYYVSTINTNILDIILTNEPATTQNVSVCEPFGDSVDLTSKLLVTHLLVARTGAQQ